MYSPAGLYRLSVASSSWGTPHQLIPVRSLPEIILNLILSTGVVQLPLTITDPISDALCLTYPSLLIFDARIIRLKRLSIFPDHTFAVERKVLNEPAPRSKEAPGSSGVDMVLIFTEAPNAPAPLLEVPTPLCIWILPV